VERVAGHAVAGELRIDARPALLRRLHLLEDHDARALRDDEAVAVTVPRTRGVLRIVVALRQRLHDGEAPDGERGDHRLGPSGEREVRLAVLDHAVRLADRVRARRAGRHHGEVRPLHPVLDRDVAAGLVDDQAGDEEGRDRARVAAALEVLPVGLLDDRESPDARADHDGEALTVLVGDRDP
jgi:hypothetical protein